MNLAVKILVAYVYVVGGTHSDDLAARFVGSYQACPAGIEHELIVVANGGPIVSGIQVGFDLIGASVVNRVNDDGWDITAYMDVAKSCSAEMLLCLGESVYFHREGWLTKIAQAWQQFGPGMYGFFSSNLICPHLCTTAFACPPQHLEVYPRPKSKFDRYQYEHGEHSFWRHIKSLGQPVKLITWDGVYDPPRWREPRDILWKGSQANCLFYCNHTDRYREANPATKRKWERAASAPYR